MASSSSLEPDIVSFGVFRQHIPKQMSSRATASHEKVTHKRLYLHFPTVIHHHSFTDSSSGQVMGWEIEEV